MRFIQNAVLALWLAFFAATASAAHTQASLILSAQTARPGDTVIAGIRLQMDPGWHTYWKNSGASGLPTSIKWNLPAGISAGEIQWPLPKKLPPDDLATYAYEDEVVLLVPLQLAADLPAGSLPLNATVSWLECQEQCVPGSAEISASLRISAETKTSPDAPLIGTWQTKLPQPAENLSVRAWWEMTATNDLRSLVMEWNSPATAGDADFFPFASDDFEVQAQVGRLPSDAGKTRLRKPVKKFSGDWPKEIGGVIVVEPGGARTGLEAKFPVSDKAPADEKISPAVVETDAPLAQPLWKMLFFAFIGGLILNVMPCVLPVIALKILGFVGESKSDPRHVRKLGLIYALGVLVSFLALAALVIGVKAAGHRAGWGMQFSNPQFIVALTVLVTLVALNLFGVFEVNLGGKVLGAAGNLSAKRGSAGAFFNGVLATILATPCTAPFLGAALGFAFAQSAPVIILVFLTVGLGLASPYVLLSWNPAWLKFLPKPGAWMEKFKIAMGFPMLATAIWLGSLVSSFYGDRSWWLGILLVFVGLAAWVFGEFIQRGGKRRSLAGAAILILLATGYVWVAEGKLEWRKPISATTNSVSQENSGGVNWQPWSREAVAAARDGNRPVLVDFTAKWCLTCNTIVKPALESASVRAKLKELNAVVLLADFTRFPPEITEELARFGRAGVPLVLVYPKNPAAPPEVLPEALTPGMVLSALDRAAK